MKNSLRFLVLSVAATCLASVHAETISALGRILPRSGVVDVTGIPGDVIVELKANEGDLVEAGQPLAYLSSRNAAIERLARAEADLVTRRNSSRQDIEVAKLALSIAETETKMATERLRRINNARDSEFVSPDQIEERALNEQRAKLKELEARQKLGTATQGADQAIRAAEAEVVAARAQLAQAEVRSPIKGRVLKRMVRAGGKVGGTELFKVGDTSGMVVVAEVYEADILKIKTGKKVTVSSAALPKKCTGVVTSIANAVYRNATETLDGVVLSRVVEVLIQMDDVTPLDRLVYLQVDVVIDL